MAEKEKSLKRPNKVVALVTYIIALIALLMGLFLPFGTNPALNGSTDAIWAFQLPQALKAAVPVQAFWDLIGDVGNTFTYSLPITFNGLIPTSELMPYGYDLGALFTVLYALVVLAGIIALIPAIVSTFSKKSKKNVALRAASFIEVAAFLFVSIFVFIQLTHFTLGVDEQWSWPLLGAFGGTFVMLVFQSIFYKKGSGIFKFILLLLSTLALMLAIYDLGAVIPPLKEPIEDLITKTESTFDGKLYFSSALGISVIGILPVLMLFCGTTTEGGAIATITAALNGEMPGMTEPMSAIQQTLFICTLILALLVLINFLLDAMGLGKTTKRYMLVSNLVRYTLELVAAALVVILPFFIEGSTTGLMSIVIAVLALIALVLNIIRLVRFDRKTKKIKKAVAAEMKRTNADEPEQAPVTELVDEPYVYVPPTFEKETVEEEPQVYNPVIYNGPSDDFIKTLSNEQKLEFSRVFLERQCGNLSFIPDYTVGGKNDRFFNNVFIYFTRLRSFVSDGLFNKMYEYGNLM